MIFARNGSEDVVELLERSQYLEAMETHENDPMFDTNRSLVATFNGTGQEQKTILHRRVKRGVLDLASMIKCVTGNRRSVMTPFNLISSYLMIPQAVIHSCTRQVHPFDISTLTLQAQLRQSSKLVQTPQLIVTSNL